jgi:hypothetical protein
VKVIVQSTRREIFMNRNQPLTRSLLFALVLVSLLVSPTPSRAGFLSKIKKLIKPSMQELHDTQLGSGSASRTGDKTVSLSSAAIDLTSKGKATIKLRGNGSLDLSGSWHSTDKNTISFTYAAGVLLKKNKTQGRGTITLRDNHIDKITVVGTYNGKDFKANFQANNNFVNPPRNGLRDEVPGGGPTAFAATASGSGSLTAPGLGDNKFSQIEVKLYSNSTAQLTLRAGSGGETQLHGFWKQGLFGVCALSNLEGDGIAGASGSLQKKGDQLSGLSLKGLLNGERFTLSFKAR